MHVKFRPDVPYLRIPTALVESVSTKNGKFITHNAFAGSLDINPFAENFVLWACTDSQDFTSVYLNHLGLKEILECLGKVEKPSTDFMSCYEGLKKLVRHIDNVRVMHALKDWGMAETQMTSRFAGASFDYTELLEKLDATYDKYCQVKREQINDAAAAEAEKREKVVPKPRCGMDLLNKRTNSTDLSRTYDDDVPVVRERVDHPAEDEQQPEPAVLTKDELEQIRKKHLEQAIFDQLTGVSKKDQPKADTKEHPNAIADGNANADGTQKAADDDLTVTPREEAPEVGVLPTDETPGYVSLADIKDSD